jgi:hypothetical protein
MNKIGYIRNYISLFDYIFWIDDDAFFIDHSRKIESILPQGNSFMSVCKSPEWKKLKTKISSGQFVIKCNDVAEQFLVSTEKTELKIVKEWWKPEHGYFTNGDQDAMVYLMETNEKFKHVDIHPANVFNSRIEDLETGHGQGVFILHLTGKREIKCESLMKAQKLLGYNEALLSQEQCDALNIPFTSQAIIKKYLYKTKLLIQKIL